MNGSIEEVGTRLNLDTESTAIGINSETSMGLKSQLGTEVDSVTVASSDSEAVNIVLDSKTWIQDTRDYKI